MKLSSALMRYAQSMMIVRRSIENFPRDKYGNTIILSQSRDRLLKTLRECAEGVDRASIAVDTQHKVALDENPKA